MKTIKRRRREFKTDYGRRIKLLKSNVPRIVFRKTNRYLIAQYIVSKEARDSVKLGLTSKNLIAHGWSDEFKGSLKSIPASYLLGLLMGKKIQDNKLEKPIVDFGMINVEHKSKVYGFLKGLKDAGLEISCKEELFPEEARIQGKNLKKDFSAEFEKIKSNIQKK